jgi:hypothetical protein
LLTWRRRHFFTRFRRPSPDWCDLPMTQWGPAEESWWCRKRDCRQHIKKRNTRCPHNAKFPLVKIDMLVNQIWYVVIMLWIISRLNVDFIN